MEFDIATEALLHSAAVVRYLVCEDPSALLLGLLEESGETRDRAKVDSAVPDGSAAVEVSKLTLNMLLANVNTAERALSLLDLHRDTRGQGERLESFLALSLSSLKAQLWRDRGVARPQRASLDDIDAVCWVVAHAQARRNPIPEAS